MPLAPLVNRPAWPDTCGIRGCKEGVSAFFETGTGRWSCKCDMLSVTAEGQTRGSYHRAWWDEPTGTWYWTSRGFVETGLARLPIDSTTDVDSLAKERRPLLTSSTVLQADVLPKQEGVGSLELLGGTLTAINLPPKDTEAQDHVCMAIVSPGNSVTRTDGAYIVPQQAEYATFIDEPSATPSVRDQGCDEPEVAPPGMCTSPAVLSVLPVPPAVSNMVDGKTTSQEDVSSCDDAWSPSGPGRRGHRRPDCRLCHTPRGGMPEQYGQLCWACKEIMRNYDKRKTADMKCKTYRRKVREESLQRRQEASQQDGAGSVQQSMHLDQQVKCSIQREPASSTCKRKPASARCLSPDMDNL